MRLPLPKSLDKNGDASLSFVVPSISAPVSDDGATVIELNGTEHRIPFGWQIAEAKSGEFDIVILRQGSTVKVLAGDRLGRIREIVGYSAALRRDLLALRLGEEAPKTAEDREIDRIAALSADTIVPANGADDSEIDRLLRLADTLEDNSADDAEVARLAKLAQGL